MILEWWKQASSIERGTSHVSTQKPCQDQVAYGKENGVHVLALADGLGSLAYSQVGADIATKIVVKKLLENFSYYLDLATNDGEQLEQFQKLLSEGKKDLIDSIVQEMIGYTQHNPQVKLQDMSCTLHFVAFNSEHYIIGHLGDGTIGALQKETDRFVIDTIAPPQKPKGAEANKTYHLLQTNAAQIMSLFAGSIKNVFGFILMSDGAGEILYHPRTGLLPKVADLFTRFIGKSPVDFSSELNKYLKTAVATETDDDLSINMIFLEDVTYYPEKDEAQPLATMVLNSLKYSNQLIKRSSYGYLIDDSYRPNHISKPITSPTQWKELIR